MAKRRTYEQKLFDDLQKLPAQKWFRIDNREDGEKIMASVKTFIDNREQFEFSKDYKMIRRLSDIPPPLEPYHLQKELPPGVTVEQINPGQQVTFTMPKGQVVTHTYERTHYRVFFKEKEISIY